MGFTVDFSPQAINALEAAVSEISKGSQERAESFGIELVIKTDILENFPYPVNIVPEFKEERIGELYHKPYRIVYQVKEPSNLVVLLRYWQCSRDYLNR